MDRRQPSVWIDVRSARWLGRCRLVDGRSSLMLYSGVDRGASGMCSSYRCDLIGECTGRLFQRRDVMRLCRTDWWALLSTYRVAMVVVC